jgi:hypothetical protein
MRYLFLVLAMLGAMSTAYAAPKGNNGEHNGPAGTNCGHQQGGC